MDTQHRLSRIAVVLAAAALVVSVAASGAPALAAKIFADNSDRVDGKHAVGASAGVNARKGKLVATRKVDGRLPDNIIKKAPDSAKLDGIKSSGFVSAKSPTARLIAEGRVTGSGDLMGAAGTGITSTRLGSGAYAITVTGQNPGCARFVPNTILTPFGVGEVSVAVITTRCDTGDVTVSISVRNSAGAAADGTFFFAMYDGGLTSAKGRPDHPSVCRVSSEDEGCR